MAKPSKCGLVSLIWTALATLGRRAFTMINLEEQKENNLLPSTSTIGAPRLQFLPRRIARFLVPTFLARNDTTSQHVVRPTDFLDGIRGYAAFSVYFGHFIMAAHPRAYIGYGGGNGKNDQWIPQLPIIRLLYSGQMGVFLFFVISGFSISLKPLKLARRGAFPAMFDALVSATFRRTARLYIPCVVMLTMTILLTCFGAFNHAFDLKKHWPFPGKPMHLQVIYNSNSEQIADFLHFLSRWLDPLKDKTFPEDMPYAGQLWTIPVELRCSLISFISLVGLAKVTTTIRIGTMIVLAIYFHMMHHPEAALFLAGGILAELHLIRQEQQSPSSEPAPESRSKKLRDIALFVFGLFLASYPRKGGDKALFWPPFYPLAKYTVGTEGKYPQYFFTSIASVLLAYVVSQSPNLQSLFTTSLARYLGRLSFALYLVHQALINWFGYRSILFWWSLTGNETVFTYELGIGIAFLAQTVVTVWCADLFLKGVDLPSISFTKWLEEKYCSNH